MKSLEIWAERVIEYSFYLLFFLVPLVFYSKNYELFEYNKMMLTYAFTIIIAASWLSKAFATKKFEIAKTPLDPFIFLFLASQVLSAIFSIDVHTSLFGYYSRFHQGLFATISYIILYYAFVTHLASKDKVIKILYSSILASIIVAVWGIFEHFGKSPSCYIITGHFDVECWIQDVKTRVFATLGQPNWMSAYLAVIIPITLGLVLEKFSKKTFSLVFGSFLTFIFYLAFLYTRSRSGFLGLWVGLTTLSLSLLKKTRQDKKTLLYELIIFLIITFFVGSGISQLDKLSFNGLKEPFTKTAITAPVNNSQSPKVATPALEGGGTESGQIRAIVWKGAIDIFRRYPLFGSGVETFAYSYYQVRPKEHNAVSEWDFLYNKAHNEYLNFLATTGLFGIIAYLSFIVGFIAWFLGKLKKSQTSILSLSLVSAFTTILITNFFGFSVVVIGILFYLIPAFVYVLEGKTEKYYTLLPEGIVTKAFSILGIIVTLLTFSKLINFYKADLDFAQGQQLSRNSKYKEAYVFLTNAVSLNPHEPLYHDELSVTLANLAISYASQKDLDTTKKLTVLAQEESNIATTISPNNLNFYKSKTKIYYTLAQIDESFTKKALEAIQKASSLAPTDPKIKYNLALLYGKNNDLQNAIATLEETISLKPDYRDARYALALYYKDLDRPDDAIKELNYILEKINPNDIEAKDKLNSWQ